MNQVNMSKVLKNYKPRKELLLGEFPYVKIIDQEDVFLDLPLAAIDFGKEYQKPVLYGNHKGIPTIHEEEEVKRILANLKKYYFTEDKGRLFEVDPKEATIKAWLPKETPVDQLIFDNGQIIWAKPIAEPKQSEETDQVEEEPVVEGAEQYGNN